MFAVKWVTDSIPLGASLLRSIAGWLLIAPLAALVPKRRDWVAVIGRQNGHFLDNAKYFFLQAPSVEPHARFVFITEMAEVAHSINRNGRQSLVYPALRGAWFLARCGSVIVDEASWHARFRYFLLIRARVVQLWHGVGFKWVELNLWRHQTGSFAWFSHPMVLYLRLSAYRFTGRRMRYAVVASTSRFYRDTVFRPAFLACHFPVTGYPRNDFARSLSAQDLDLAWSNVDSGIKQRLADWTRVGRRLVLVAPTFRESGEEPMRLDDATRATIEAFAEAHGVDFLFKFHPSERNVARISGRHFHVCTRNSDIYPLFPYAAALVTDYSSIGMDFLIVDKPVLFLIRAEDDYATRDRLLQFDPRTMMPGPVVTDWHLLLDALLAEWAHDSYAPSRAALRDKAFDSLPQSNAVPKLITLMRDHGWLRKC